MSPSTRFRGVVLLLGGLALLGGLRSWLARSPERPEGFLAQVDLSPLEDAAVHGEGRIKSFASHANGIMDFVTGPKRFAGQTPVMTYLDLIFRPEAAVDADLIFVKNKSLRAQVIDVLDADGRPAEERAALSTRLSRFLDEGLISERLLSEPAVSARLQALGADLIRWARFVQMVDGALGWKDAQVLAENLRVVPPPPGAGEAWFALLDLTRPSLLSEGLPASDAGPGCAPLDVDLRTRLGGAWRDLGDAWRAADAPGVTAAAAALAQGLREVNPEVYPERTRLSYESFYFRAYNLTWIWMVYLLAVVPLLVSTVHAWSWSRRLGLLLFAVAFGLHTWALLLRWYVSGRWPNSNMFEAVTTAAWFGGVAAVGFWAWLRGSLGNLFLLTSAVASMVALMCAYYLPVQLNPNISNKMPVLHDVWLYIHTNVIIWSYVLIFMAAVSAALYLLWRLCGHAPAAARGAGGVRALGRTALDRGAVGPGATGVAASAGGPSAHIVEPAGTGAVLDGVTMVLMQLSFVMLWAGLVMGAIWADHSWGRPWGWDPKEVFALNTFLVFAILVHGRLKLADKALWTAWLAVLGAAVMLFNWIVINFIITGLHSYA